MMSALRPVLPPAVIAVLRSLALACLWAVTASPAAAVTRVLFLGDSFSKGPFGRTLDTSLRAAGLEVYTSVAGGASAYDWLPEFGATSCDIGYWEKTPKKEFRVTYLSRVPKIDEMVSRWKPNVVAIQGGTNMYSVLTSKRRPHDQNVAELERLLARIGEIVTSSGARLYWITPATAHPQRFSPQLQAEMKQILTRVASRYGKVYDSYAVTRFTEPYPGSDGIHYGPSEANAWSRLVATDLIAFSAGRAGATPRAGRGAGRSFWDIFRRDRAPGGAPPPSSRGESSPAVPAGPPPTVRRAEVVHPTGPVPAAENELEVEVILKSKSAVRSLAEVTYRSALGVFEYEVVRVNRGSYPFKTIRIAHLIVMNNRYTSINDRPLGSRMSLTLERLSRYPNLLKIHTVDDLEPAFDLDLFVPKL